MWCAENSVVRLMWHRAEWWAAVRGGAGEYVKLSLGGLNGCGPGPGSSVGCGWEGLMVFARQAPQWTQVATLAACAMTGSSERV